MTDSASSPVDLSEPEGEGAVVSPEADRPAQASESEAETAAPEAVTENGVGEAETVAPEALANDAAGDGETAAPDTPAEADAPAPAAPPDPAMAEFQSALADGRLLEGKVIGWNRGGFHVVVDGTTAFCPRSEMEIGRPRSPKTYLDRSFAFRALKIEGSRVVLSRAVVLRAERTERRRELVGRLRPGSVLDGRVTSLTDFGVFVDIGGVQGLVHVSEISRTRVEHPSEALAVGDAVKVQVLRVEEGGRRISLSMKRLEPDPWEGVRSRFMEGAVVKGTIEKIAPFGAFVALEPGLTGLLPTSGVDLPRGSSLARMYPPGKEISVQILRVDARKRRISLALEGSQMEGTRADFESYVRERSEGQGGFNALAAALEKLQKPSD